MKKTCDNCDVKHMRFSCKCGVENGICLGWIADYETLENEVKELKRKLEICEKHLKKLAECDICVHQFRDAGLCEGSCDFEVQYGN